MKSLQIKRVNTFNDKQTNIRPNSQQICQIHVTDQRRLEYVFTHYSTSEVKLNRNSISNDRKCYSLINNEVNKMTHRTSFENNQTKTIY